MLFKFNEATNQRGDGYVTLESIDPRFLENNTITVRRAVLTAICPYRQLGDGQVIEVQFTAMEFGEPDDPPYVPMAMN